ncbi:SH3 domain-binding glutamic acid-rich protein homolog [Agrilus planipennis]|uniref:SH3 domain-binding glutamic acid-rich protein homolog n=1 Tax=Agrilus planipennis TaxID=224129 RepID=A0A1W4WG90_AGRPL|nr:SH3 domain-binding glutamic acid-rich protein homolog [Agrilus planipennis]XP_025835815.1 SH3 domain-binding glutamic acid-rich protein homolog [Agrilus planipennis]
MVVKVYISGISGNKEVKKRQQRVLMILDSKNIKYEVVDIAEPGNEEAKEFMQNNSKSLGATIGDANPKHALPPQVFNDEEYCGDYDLFDLANEVDEVEKFLKLEPSDTVITSNAEIKLENGEIPVESIQDNFDKLNGKHKELDSNEENKETADEGVTDSQDNKEESEEQEKSEENEELKKSEENAIENSSPEAEDA